jgi:hypothetical protein
MMINCLTTEAQRTQRGKAATKQAFNPQISQITQILLIIIKNNAKNIGFHDLPSKN